MRRKISPVFVVGMILTISCFTLYVSGPEFIQDISYISYDAFMRRVAEPPKSGKVVIVDIDDATLSDPSYGQWPWPRYLVADMTRRMIEAGARVIAFDVILSERDRTSPILLKERIHDYFKVDVDIAGIPPQYHDFDLMLADVLKLTNTVLGCFMVPSGKSVVEMDLSIDKNYEQRYLAKSIAGGQVTNVDAQVRELLMPADNVLLAIPSLAKTTKSAFLNAVTDSDGIVRQNPLVWAYGTRIYPSLSLEVVRLYKGVTKGIVEMREGYGVEAILLKDIRIPTDQLGRLVVNYRQPRKDAGSTGLVSSFPTFPARDVMSGKVGKKELEGMIVFVGTSAVGLKDIKATPVSQHFSGVEVHATIVDNILAGDLLQLPGAMIAVHSFMIIAMGAFLTFFIARGRSWLSFLVSGVLIFLVIWASVLLLGKFHLVFVPVWVIVTVLVMYPVLTMIKFWEEEVQKKRVRNMFGTMVSKDVLRYLETNPESFALSGKKAEATMFFSDVAGFTTLSESLEPAKLSELLNRYLSPMTHIIMNHNGYVDKFEGDLIMAVWGVPYPMADHALQACQAALEQQAKLDEIRAELKEEFGHEINVRMGINSGVVTAGNMGSDLKFQYTVMGDAVNQASRYEPANKVYGTRITIGELTYEAVKDHMETRLLDRIRVVGKTKPVHIYELVGPKGTIAKAKLNAMSFYVQALRLQWDRKWDEAIACLDQALSLDPGDTPCVRIRERIALYKDSPPAAGWMGEYIQLSKD